MSDRMVQSYWYWYWLLVLATSAKLLSGSGTGYWCKATGSGTGYWYKAKGTGYSKCMTEIEGKSILVRVSEGSSYRESTVYSRFVLVQSANASK